MPQSMLYVKVIDDSNKRMDKVCQCNHIYLLDKRFITLAYDTYVSLSLSRTSCPSSSHPCSSKERFICNASSSHSRVWAGGTEKLEGLGLHTSKWDSSLWRCIGMMRRLTRTWEFLWCISRGKNKKSFTAIVKYNARRVWSQRTSGKWAFGQYKNNASNQFNYLLSL